MPQAVEGITATAMANTMAGTIIITIATATIMAMTEPMASEHLYRLSSWLSPSFPVGAYTYSSGLEYAVECGLVADASDLECWLSDMLISGSGAVEGVFFCAAWRAAAASDGAAMKTVVERADATRASSEMALESAAQGDAFLKAIRDAWPRREYELLDDVLRGFARKPAYSVAVGAVCGFNGIPLRPSLVAFLHALAANLVSAGVRLIPLGQTQGQRVIAGLEAAVERATSAAACAAMEDIATSTPVIDWTSMRHETQYTRLFRT